MTLRDRIRELANERGMSLPDLEAALGFGNGTIVKWDKASPNTEKLKVVADFFDVSLDYLVGRQKSSDSSELDGAFFRLKKGLEPYGLDKDDADFLLTVYRAHKEKNK
ncbi:helix-turn-helix domain-containing protein [Caproiciproducens sp. CPB-2]|uniref:helix-turn-helix domain-containing protein n=1 Tax=Caproiciproducens sp. CPB-2 TaxID=3030017 RepID=UPI0023DB70E0|nr:helix-turn-helix transcriptional regulator [Caproiciproducens sp. CPB-2]MDF1495184.1 helix-turn-helix transcriptional regulator [Caproiciproducens sp. CPB-2]